jgi:2-dehydro-3-deoxyphosphogluconate aldolase/(4S)-4-hydroxy-2-oxoglutarate aldolase
MVYRHEAMARIAKERVIAIVRQPTAESARQVCAALIRSDMGCIEVTTSTPDWEDLVRELSSQALAGAGTVLDPSQAVRAAEAGAAFVVTPNFDRAVIAAAHRHGLATVVGCGTATEALAALEAGADAVKLFPASSLGPGFLKALHGPVPWAPCVPTGGVSVETVADWMAAGALAVAMGASLVIGSPEEVSDRVTRLWRALEPWRN